MLSSHRGFRASRIVTFLAIAAFAAQAPAAEVTFRGYVSGCWFCDGNTPDPPVPFVGNTALYKPSTFAKTTSGGVANFDSIDYDFCGGTRETREACIDFYLNQTDPLVNNLGGLSQGGA